MGERVSTLRLCRWISVRKMRTDRMTNTQTDTSTDNKGRYSCAFTNQYSTSINHNRPTCDDYSTDFVFSVTRFTNIINIERCAVSKGGATIFKVGVQVRERSERKKFFWRKMKIFLGYINNILWPKLKSGILWQFQSRHSHNSHTGLCYNHLVQVGISVYTS